MTLGRGYLDCSSLHPCGCLWGCLSGSILASRARGRVRVGLWQTCISLHRISIRPQWHRTCSLRSFVRSIPVRFFGRCHRFEAVFSFSQLLLETSNSLRSTASYLRWPKTFNDTCDGNLFEFAVNTLWLQCGSSGVAIAYRDSHQCCGGDQDNSISPPSPP
jgi:hypothetical protein